MIISNYFVILLKNKMFLTEKDGIINLLYNFYIQQIFIYASNEPKSVLARDHGVAKRQWRLFSNDRNGV